MGTYYLSSPFSVPTSKKKSFTLNLNQYRNAHYHVLNQAKKAYKEHMREQIEVLPVMDYIVLKLVIYPKTRRLFDVANLGSVTEKFFADALVELGKIPDDSYQYIAASSCMFGSIDKDNPRIEVQIHEVQREH